LATNVYECMFILDSNRYARDPGGVAGQIPQMIEKCGGEVLASRLWNEQRLAYPINGQRKGAYWLTYFRMESAQVATFNRECRLSDSILRNLTLKVDARLADTLVAHARGEKPVTEESENGEPEKAAAAASEPSAEPASEESGDAASGESTD
jgi:small subunit ribosomal protein S6